MDGHQFEALIGACVPADRVQRHAPLASLTTFKVGGPADWLIDVTTIEELAAVTAAARQVQMPVTVLGGGSNVLVGDRGIRGAVVRVRLQAISAPAPDRVRAEAGVTINGLVRWTVGRGLAAVEAWAGTPGTVGGAVYGNAHFNGRNISDLVVQAHLLTPDGTFQTVPAAALEFAYDSSRLKRTREILVWAEFAASPGTPEALREVARASLALRKRTQPLESPSAGCIFQNPDPGRDQVPAGVPASAGALIDRAGLKGARAGGASVSSTHANFFINDGRATAAEIRRLVEQARQAVRDRFGVELRDEIVILGEF